MRPLKLLILPLFLVLFSATGLADPCEWPPPNNWPDKIVDLPSSCEPGLKGVFTIVAEPGWGLNGIGELRDVILITNPETVPNEREFFSGSLYVRTSGYGALAGFTRDLQIPVTGEFRFDPQNPAESVRTVAGSIHSLQGQIFGDPDFCYLEVIAGEAFGLPSPGTTTLTQLPNGNFNVDSFFDVTYQIEFEGCPGSALDGISRSSVFTERYQLGEPYLPVIDHNCQLPDNGTGAIDLPPECPDGYVGVLSIVDGLPPGTEITGEAVLKDIVVTNQGPGGILGGEFQIFDAVLHWQAVGTGDLTGFVRNLAIPVTCETNTGPRVLGDPVQIFGSDLVALQGQLFGDPDFCDLIVVAGESNGLPSPGSTTTTKLPTGDFAVDSFFDITYRIEFTGCPGSIIEALSGSTVGASSFQAGEWYIVSGVGNPVTPRLSLLYQNTPNPFNPMTVIRYDLPPGNGRVALDIFDLRGRHICNLVDEVQTGGTRFVTWYGTDDRGRRVASGVYFYALKTARETLVRKMAILK